MGPHHPSTTVSSDGCGFSMARRVVKLKSCLLSASEPRKIGENTSYSGSMPYTDRLDIFLSLTKQLGLFCAIGRKLAGLQVPERAEYIRVITAELTRLAKSRFARGVSFAGHGARSARRSCTPSANAKKS